MRLDVHKICQRLFESPKRSRIMRDYGLTASPATADQFTRMAIEALDQPVAADPLDQDVADTAIFRSAVRSLGSNSRAWSTFLANEPRLAKLLGGYDPTAAAIIIDHQDLHDAVKACLPGQTASNDTRAIGMWGRLLTGREGYYAQIVAVAQAFRHLAVERDVPVADEHVPLCIAGLMAAPPHRWPGHTYLPGHLQNISTLKLPGMKYALASEFLRNLGFSSFKPDRHICRLFDRWFPRPWTAEERLADRLSALIGSRNRELVTYLTYAAKGINVTPSGMHYSHADNLVWMLGAYVETKNNESNESYVIRGN